MVEWLGGKGLGRGDIGEGVCDVGCVRQTLPLSIPLFFLFLFFRQGGWALYLPPQKKTTTCACVVINSSKINKLAALLSFLNFLNRHSFRTNLLQSQNLLFRAVCPEFIHLVTSFITAIGSSACYHRLVSLFPMIVFPICKMAVITF